jgi:hypothetical protein
MFLAAATKRESLMGSFSSTTSVRDIFEFHCATSVFLIIEFVLISEKEVEKSANRGHKQAKRTAFPRRCRVSQQDVFVRWQEQWIHERSILSRFWFGNRWKYCAKAILGLVFEL